MWRLPWHTLSPLVENSTAACVSCGRIMRSIEERSPCVGENHLSYATCKNISSFPIYSCCYSRRYRPATNSNKAQSHSSSIPTSNWQEKCANNTLPNCCCHSYKITATLMTCQQKWMSMRISCRSLYWPRHPMKTFRHDPVLSSKLPSKNLDYAHSKRIRVKTACKKVV